MAPRVLICGGTGFIGRNLVAYLVENNLAESIRVADKVMPATAYLNEKCKKAFDNPVVDYKQCNLVNPCKFPFERQK